MLLALKYILVKQITSDVPCMLSDAALNKLAESILKVEGSLSPMVVKRVKSSSYESETYKVVKGHSQYYAAVRAKKLNPRDGESIGVFIIEGAKSEALEEQLEILKMLDS